MKRAAASLILVSVIAACCCDLAEAQQPKKAVRVGFLVASSASVQESRVEAFRRGLRDFGYVEGQNITIDYRYGEGNPDRLTVGAAELVRLKVDVIVTAGPAATRPAKEATSTIPIVMMQDSDPVSSGFIASLARPGGNITGLSTLAPEISGKRLELLKEIVPKLARVAVFGNSNNPESAQAFKEAELAAGALAVQLKYIEVRDPKDIETAFRAASNGRANAILVLSATPALLSQHELVAVLAVKNRLPAVYHRREYVEAGGLLFYGVNNMDLARRAAFYVDKILKGAKPADLPVEQPTKFELVINLKTAKQIGLTIPPNVLARADKVIK
jgi:ABC-type uncharacterized transport system substrate-binding protein